MTTTKRCFLALLNHTSSKKSLFSTEMAARPALSCRSSRRPIPTNILPSNLLRRHFQWQRLRKPGDPGSAIHNHSPQQGPCLLALGSRTLDGIPHILSGADIWTFGCDTHRFSALYFLRSWSHYHTNGLCNIPLDYSTIHMLTFRLDISSFRRSRHVLSSRAPVQLSCPATIRV